MFTTSTAVSGHRSGTDAVASGPGGADTPGAGGKLTVGAVGEVDTLNPLTYILANSYALIPYLFEALTSPSHDSLAEQGPGLAESWDVAADGLTVTYHMRPGLKWSDGKPLTSADAAYTLGRVLEGGPGNSTWGNYLDNVKSVEAPDDSTVELSLGAPSATLPKMPIPILPKHIFEHYPDDRLDQYPLGPKSLVTSGPYRLLEGGSGSSLYRFEAWPGNWRGLSPVTYVDWRFFKAQDTIMQAIRKGEIDYTSSVNALQVRKLKSRQHMVANQFPLLGNFVEVGFNSGSADPKTGDPLGDPNPAVLDPKFRFALSTAFDPAELSHKAFKGGLSPLRTIVPDGFPDFQWKPPADGTTYDPKLAAKRLDEAGYKLNADGRRTLPNGRSVPRLRIAVDASDQSSLLATRLVREWMQNLGFDIKIDAMTADKLTDEILSGNYDMFWWGWGFSDDPDAMLVYLTCDQRSLQSDSWYCSKEYDDLYTEQKNELDHDKRVEIVKKMQQVLYRDAPYIVMGQPMAQQAYRSDRWTGWTSAFQPGGDVMADVTSLYSLRPTDGAAQDVGADRTARTATVVYRSLATLIVVWLLGRFAVARWRRATAEERE
ncbi:ABC transporter substrate-binding protein [Embleya hyalina]|uniref:Peptide ABC transporter substrate-binding protein n=1 Tax=Embleya hyalina TaxID=516124 RepID=A0A401YVK8_9ACTN|nr:ABC transporter substrate-binding protein [Embleya hyalina]GCD98609.1 peptide ABC transporter substrate-binding protein [Embleya hyalina]